MKDEPERLVDDPGLAVGLRADLARVRRAEPAYDEGRGLERLRAALVTGPVATSASTGDEGGASAPSATTAAETTTGGGAFGGAAGKWLVLVLGTGLVTATVFTLTVHSGSRTAETNAATKPMQPPLEDVPAGTPPAETSPYAAITPPATASAAGEPFAPARAESQPGAAAKRRHEGVSVRARGAAAAPAPAVPSTSTAAALDDRGATAAAGAIDGDQAFREEIEQLARARALLDPDPAAAFALLQRGARAYAGGIFDEERAALSIIALDRLGRRDEARERARRFLSTYGRGAFAERVRHVLEGAPSRQGQGADGP